jgi:methyltransferase (TIGR00027 family)
MILPPVSQTAVGVAAIRAAESARPDRLFDDPLAAGFAQAAGWVRPADAQPPTPEQIFGRERLTSWVTVRTRFLDDVVLSACAGSCRQVVILGAGLDARAFRLAWPAGTRLWELDLPDVVEFKSEVLRAGDWQPRCERFVVPVDLSEDWGDPLRAAGFDPGAPVAWIAEGLLAYLPAEVRDSLIARTAALSVPGSRMGLTLANTERLRTWREAHPDGRGDPRDYVALWQSAAPDDPTEWLAENGWRAELFDMVERSGAYGRPLVARDGTPADDGTIGAGTIGAGENGGRSQARLVDATRI